VISARRFASGYVGCLGRERIHLLRVGLLGDWYQGL
jgi:hypothetical protein